MAVVESGLVFQMNVTFLSLIISFIEFTKLQVNRDANPLQHSNCVAIATVNL